MSKQLLLEGIDGGFVGIPSVGYVQQGKKAWFFAGKPAGLTESAALENVAIVESVQALDLEEVTLTTGKKVRLPKDGIWVVEGVYQRSDTRNANKRVYPRSIWDRLIKDESSYVQVAAKANKLVGHVEHPASGRTDLNELALVTTRLTLREDGTVWGRSQLLSTPKGMLLQTLCVEGVPWGVSSRGNGSVDSTGKVGDDYELNTWDAVASPSTPGAFPSPVHEGTAPNTPAKPAGETRSAEPPSAVVEAAKTALRVGIDTLPAEKRAELAQTLVEHATALSTALETGKLPAATAAALLPRIAIRLGALAVAGSRTVDEAIREALEGDDEESKSKPAEAMVGVVSELRRQVDESATEIVNLGQRLEVAESERRSLRTQRDRYAERLAVSEEKLDAITRQLNLANRLLAERPAREDRKVTEAVAAVVQAEPSLAPLRPVLEALGSAEAVRAEAAKLLPALVENEPAAEPAPSPGRVRAPRPLPEGLRVVSDDFGPMRTEAVDETVLSGVSVAADALSRLGR